jgi:lipid A disaccharide synthetase
MSRPKIHENLVPITISIDREVKEELLREGFNISEICRAATENAINDPEVRKMFDKFEQISEDIKTDVIQALSKGLEYSKGYVKIIKIRTGINITRPELIRWFKKRTGNNDG